MAMLPDPAEPVRLVRLTTVSGAFAAHVLAARLTDEGFDPVLHGAAIASTYGLTMGAMAHVDVLVPADQVAEASYVLLVNEVDVTLDEEPEERRRAIAQRIAWPWRVVAATILVGSVAATAHSLHLVGAAGLRSPAAPSARHP